MNYYEYEVVVCDNDLGTQEIRRGVITEKTIHNAFMSLYDFYKGEGKVLQIEIYLFPEDINIFEI